MLGIEGYEQKGESISISYTIQDLSQTQYDSCNQDCSLHTVEFTATANINDERLSHLRPGATHLFRGDTYKILEYTEIFFDGQEMHLSFLSRPVYPIEKKDARAKLILERKKKLHLEVL